MNPDLGVQVVVNTDEADKAQIRALENEVRALKAQIEQKDRDLAAMAEKCRRLDRMDKGLNLIQKWAEDKDDEFLTDLVELIDE